MAKTNTKGVSLAERRMAIEMANETFIIEQKGAMAVARATVRAKTMLKRALRNGTYYPGFIAKTMLESLDELTDAVFASYLMGRRRAMLNSRLSLSRASSAAKKLSEVFKMTADQVEELKGRFREDIRPILLLTGQYADQHVQQALIESLTKGEHVRQGVKRLEQAFNTSGIQPAKPYRLEAIFRTQCQLAYSGAKWQADQQGYVAELLWGYKYVTAGDDRVRPAHAKMDGMTLPKNDPRWATLFPPNGWNCRCQAIEIFEPREIVEPPRKYVLEGVEYAVEADPGFNFNPGHVLPQTSVTAEIPSAKPVVEPRKPKTVVEEIADRLASLPTPREVKVKFEPDVNVKSTTLNKVKEDIKSVTQNPVLNTILQKHQDLKIRVHGDDLGGGTVGRWTVDYMIHIGGEFTRKEKKTIPAPKKGGWMVDDSRQGYLRHEIGHQIYAYDKEYGKHELSNAVKALYKEVKKEPGKAKKLLSEYGLTNDHEFFAELFSLVTHEGFDVGRFEGNDEWLKVISLMMRKQE